MGFKRRSKSQLALSLLDTAAGQELVRERLSVITKELAALDAERKRLETERAQLEPLVRDQRRKGAVKSNGRSKRSISTQRVLGALGREPQSKAAIAEKLNANPERLKKPLEALIEDGAVKRIGRGRGTRYSLD